MVTRGWKPRRFARCSGDFGQIAFLPVVLLGSFRQNQPVVTLRVHGISFEAATEVFSNPNHITNESYFVEEQGWTG